MTILIHRHLQVKIKMHDHSSDPSPAWPQNLNYIIVSRSLTISFPSTNYHEYNVLDFSSHQSLHPAVPSKYTNVPPQWTSVYAWTYKHMQTVWHAKLYKWLTFSARSELPYARLTAVKYVLCTFEVLSLQRTAMSVWRVQRLVRVRAQLIRRALLMNCRLFLLIGCFHLAVCHVLCCIVSRVVE